MKKPGLRDIKFFVMKYTDLEFKLIYETPKAPILSHSAIMPHLYAQPYVMPHYLFFPINLNKYL